MIRLSKPSIEEDDLESVRNVLMTGYLVQGQHVASFEEKVANYIGNRYAIAVNNCTVALYLSLLAIGVQPGDIVIVTTYSWPATTNVIEWCGAQPVFVDITQDSFNLAPEMLQQTLDRLMTCKATAARVKAILPVHTFGQMADMKDILNINQEYQIPIIEDAACALGAKHCKMAAGTFGKIGCFSFHPRKAITTGEGGMITTNDATIARHIKALRNHGLDSEVPISDFIIPGLNFRLTEIQGALGISQMSKIERIIQRRIQMAKHYDELLKGTGVRPPLVTEKKPSIYQSYVVLLPLSVAERRAEIIQKLKQKEIETTIGTWHIPLTRYYRAKYGYQKGDFPVTDDVFTRSLALPIHEYLSEDEQEKVIATLLDIILDMEKG